MFNHPVFRGFRVLLIVLLVSGAATLPSIRAASPRPAAADDDDKEEMLRFSTVGDSRQDPDAPDPTLIPLSAQDAIWLQSTKAWSRIIDEIHLQRSQFLFFNGDMIMGYGNAGSPADTSVATVVKSDLMKFYRQYGFWRGMVAGLMERGTYVVPVPGNHETQWKHKVSGVTVKEAIVANEEAWRANMGDLILDTPRFTNLFGSGPTFKDVNDNHLLDGLTTSQEKLSYSFEFNNCHFAVINTDPVGGDALAPTNWLDQDLAGAVSRGVRRCFVFGHKPAFTYWYGAVIPAPPALPLPGKPSGLDNTVDYPLPADRIARRDAFWDVIEKYNATYFCGHEHIFNMSQPRGKAWQVIVGSGGSPFEAAPDAATINPDTDRDYAWATVRVMRNGKMHLTVYGFNDQFGQTHVLNSITIP